MAQLRSTDDVIEAIELLRSELHTECAAGLVFSSTSDVAHAIGCLQRWVTITRPACRPRMVVMSIESVTVTLSHESRPYWRDLLGLSGGAGAA